MSQALPLPIGHLESEGGGHWTRGHTLGPLSPVWLLWLVHKSPDVTQHPTQALGHCSHLPTSCHRLRA